MKRLVSPPLRLDSYRAVLTVVASSTFVAMLAYSGPLGNAATLFEALDASPAERTWMPAAMSSGLAVTLPVAGVVADRIGHRRVFVIGALVFAVANLTCALVGDMPPFIAGRLLAGVGATGMIVTGLGLVASVDQTSARRSTTAVWWSVSLGAGIAVGPLTSGALDLVDSWRSFYVILALAGIVLWAAASRMTEGRRERTGATARLDVLGAALLVGSLVTTITAIVNLRTGTASVSLGLFVGAALLFAALLASQRFGTRRLVDPGPFSHRPFLATTAAGLGTGLGVIAVMSFACTYLVEHLGMSTLHAGLVLAAWSGTSAVGALAFSRLTTSLPGPAHLVIGLAGVALGMALLVGIGPSSSDLRPLPGLVIAGLATGLLNTGLAGQAVATVPAHSTATGIAVNNTVRYLGASIGVSVAAVLAAHGDMAAGWNRVAWTGAATSLGFALLVALLSRSPREKATPVSVPGHPLEPRGTSPSGSGPA